MRVDEAEGEHGAANLSQGGWEPVHGRYEEQRVGQLVTRQPGHQLDQEHRGPLSGQELVFALVGPQWPTDHPEDEVDSLVDGVEQERPASPRNDERPHDVGRDRQPEQGPTTAASTCKDSTTPSLSRQQPGRPVQPDRPGQIVS